jgi:hypothetical protein
MNQKAALKAESSILQERQETETLQSALDVLESEEQILD